MTISRFTLLILRASGFCVSSGRADIYGAPLWVYQGVREDMTVIGRAYTEEDAIMAMAEAYTHAFVAE
jgi:hypothetical protein